MYSKVIFRCISEKGKLRIRIESFIDENGTRHDGVYNNSYNCQFPRDIRVEGQLYEAPASTITFVDGSRPFYRVNRKYVKKCDALTPHVSTIARIFGEDLTECVVCMDAAPQVVFSPCGHMVCCKSCNDGIISKICPICRSGITGIIMR